MKISPVFVVKKIMMRSTIVLSFLIFLTISVRTVIMTTKTANVVCDLINKINKSNDRINHVTAATILFTDTDNYLHRNMIFKSNSMISNSMKIVFDSSFFFFSNFEIFRVFCACFYRRFFLYSYRASSFSSRDKSNCARYKFHRSTIKIEAIRKKS